MAHLEKIFQLDENGVGRIPFAVFDEANRLCGHSGLLRYILAGPATGNPFLPHHSKHLFSFPRFQL
uniref:Uncharacterized protein n=1 Tax=Podoviridae sp. ct6BA50 TaxID=2825221 RepID=A0A8S5VG47_9CAUD|nr:MAG TPA: hypothetical protein [Podoviridae sp. ct6BA50]DAQ40845.1 MAG TPA: hypothetical protein [Caudoviricetes sp.]